MTLQLKIGELNTRSKVWRLNEELLHDRAIEERMKKELEMYFKENNTEGVSEMTVWEAHKAFIRGIMIKGGGEKKEH